MAWMADSMVPKAVIMMTGVRGVRLRGFLQEIGSLQPFHLQIGNDHIELLPPEYLCSLQAVR